MRSASRFASFAILVATLASTVVAQDPPTTAPAKTEPVDFRVIRDALPATLAGLPKGEAQGQRSKFGEVTMTTAEAQYGKDEGESPKTGKITVLDYGNAEFAKGINSMWLATEIDQESDNEYTKTVDVQGRRALISYNSAEKRGTVQTSAGSRMIVTVELNNTSNDEFKKALEELPLKKLDELVTAAK